MNEEKLLKSIYVLNVCTMSLVLLVGGSIVISQILFTENYLHAFLIILNFGMLFGFGVYLWLRARKVLNSIKLKEDKTNAKNIEDRSTGLWKPQRR